MEDILTRICYQKMTTCSRSITIISMLLMALPLTANDYFYQINPTARLVDGKLFLEFEPEPVMPRNVAGNPYYSINSSYSSYFLDAPIRRAAELLIAIDENFRAESDEAPVVGEWQDPSNSELITLKFRIIYSRLNGLQLDQQYVELKVGLSNNEGYYRITFFGPSYEAPIVSLSTAAGYKTFLVKLLEPFQKKFPIDKSGKGVFELSMTWPLGKKHQAVPAEWFGRDLTYRDRARALDMPGARSAEFLDQNPLTSGSALVTESGGGVRDFGYLLGNSLVSMENGQPITSANTHTRRFRQSIRN